jgi:uncharacterized protein (UPF0261 family)
MSRVVLIGTYDTKDEKLLFLRDRLVESGVNPVLVDVGVGEAAGVKRDVSNHDIAAAAGANLEELRAAGDRGKAVDAMMRGCAAKIAEMHAASPIDGILAIGGSAGTTIATAAMRALPAGVPKMMVSTLASGDVRPYVDTKDIAMMYSITDFTGLNRLSRRILANAAHAVAGMANGAVPEADSDKPMVAATMFGVTTPCVNRVHSLLDAKGYEVVVFHATGSGGRSMEGLLADGFFEGVIDITTTELADELAGGVLSAGPDRMEIAGQRGLPQVISLGAMDMVNFGPKDSVPEKFKGRLFYEHNPTVTLMRTTPEECAQLGEIVAKKASAAKGPVTILIPLRGVSAIDAEGQVFYDADADRALFNAVRANAEENVTVVEVDAHINDDAFADALVDTFLSQRS